MSAGGEITGDRAGAMAFLIRTTSFTADGRELVRSATIAKPEIRIGRSAESDIHLPDLAVTPDHARIERIDARRITVRATGTLGFDVDGRPSQSVEIDSATGAELRFGGHRITVSRSDAGEVVLSVQRTEALSDAAEERDEHQVFSLAGTMIGKRPLAWAAVALILLSFLAVPIASYLARPQEDTRNIYTLMKQKDTAKDVVLGDSSWSSGPLSKAHHGLEGKCESCHTQVFVSVRDSACKTCHTDVHDHAPPNRIAQARAEAGIGGQLLASVAHAFGKPGPGACVDCHREHEGAGAMQPTPQIFCADCHASLDQRLKDTRLGNAADFGTDHPQFRPAVMTVPGKHPRFERISLDRRPQDNNGLKFPHDLHLSRTGGVARMAQRLADDRGYGDALACKDCHVPTSDGVRFKPVEMEQNCQACHSLGFETIGGTVRTLRHGEPDQVVADLRAFYRSTGPTVPIQLGGMARRRPGQYAEGQVYHAYFGAVAARPNGADAAIAAVFSRGGACYDCHTVTPPGVKGNANWAVLPVHQTSRFFQKGWFDHAAHKTEKCESCHAAPTSREATDLLLPDLTSCRECHGGEKSRSDVPSSCALCHSYHMDDGAPWVSQAGISAVGPEQKRRKHAAERVAAPQ